MSDLSAILREGESWLMEHVLRSVTERENPQYVSALEEVWHLSFQGLTGAILEAIDAGRPLANGSGPATSHDALAAFGELEARRHRTRGVSLEMFLGLLQYYRPAYLDLVRNRIADAAESERSAQAIDRCFDRIERAFCLAWAQEAEAGRLLELQGRNLELVTERDRYVTIFESLPVPILLLDPDHSVRNMNHAARLLFLGPSVPGDWYYRGGEKPAATILTSLFPRFREDIGAFVAGGNARKEFQWSVTHAGEARTFRVVVSRMLDLPSRFAGILVILNDLTERERLITELSTALAEVKQLSGLLPICAWCKKIRDDQGYWSQLDKYLSSHTGIVFTHGVCPDCLGRLRAEDSK